MYLKKEFQQLTIGKPIRIEPDLDTLCVCPVIPIRRIGNISTCVPYHGRNNTRYIAYKLFDAPKTASG